MERDLQTIPDPVEQLRLEMSTNFQAMQAQLNTMEQRLLTEMSTNFQAVQTQMSTNFQAVRAQLSTVEDGVLTIAQKLLAEAEVAELKTKMRKVG